MPPSPTPFIVAITWKTINTIASFAFLLCVKEALQNPIKSLAGVSKSWHPLNP